MHKVWQSIVIHISIQGLAWQRVLGWQGWEPLQGGVWQRCYFRILRQKTERQCVCVHVCVSECVSLLTRARKDKESWLLFSLEARGSGWFWGCVSEPSWRFSPSCWTAQQEAETVTNPTLFCREKIDFSIKQPLEKKNPSTVVKKQLQIGREAVSNNKTMNWLSGGQLCQRGKCFLNRTLKMWESYMRWDPNIYSALLSAGGQVK